MPNGNNPLPQRAAATAIATVTSSSAADPPIDLAELSQRCLDDRTFAMKLLEKFGEQIPHILDSLAKAIGARDARAVAQETHCLRGVAANLSAQRLVRLCAALERAMAQSDFAEGERFLRFAKEEIDRCLSYIPQAKLDLGKSSL